MSGAFKVVQKWYVYTGVGSAGNSVSLWILGTTDISGDPEASQEENSKENSQRPEKRGKYPAWTGQLGWRGWVAEVDVLPEIVETESPEDAEEVCEKVTRA